ncbi:MFS transporter [Streptomyces yangpuensis]|uniref:MFS transporter n=1 Tax=Streptomyces yangpuensis TaxID=1648182 RepID=UPI0038000B3D
MSPVPDRTPARAPGPAPGGAPTRLLRNRGFTSLVTVQAVSVLGNQIMSIALPLLTLELTGSPAQAGIVAGLGAAPYVVFSLVAGALVDRWDHRTVLMVCNVLRAGVILWVPLAHAAGLLSVVQLYVVSLATGTAFVFFNIAELKALPLTVDTVQLQKASSVNAVTESTGGLIGPGVGGTLVGLGSTPLVGGVLALFVAAVSYAVSVLPLFALPRSPARTRTSVRRAGKEGEERAGGGGGSGIRGEIVEGLAFLWHHRAIRRIALVSAGLNLLFSPAYLAVMVLAGTDLHMSDAAIGLLFSLGGAAGILGGVLAPRLTRRLTHAKVIVGSLAAWAVVMPLLPWAMTPAMLVAGWMLVTLISPVYDVTQLSYRLSLISDELQGRVNSTFRFIAWGLRPLATGAGGLVTAALGPRATLGIAAGGMVLLALGAVLTSRRRPLLPANDGEAASGTAADTSCKDGCS